MYMELNYCLTWTGTWCLLKSGALRRLDWKIYLQELTTFVFAKELTRSIPWSFDEIHFGHKQMYKWSWNANSTLTNSSLRCILEINYHNPVLAAISWKCELSFQFQLFSEHGFQIRDWHFVIEASRFWDFCDFLHYSGFESCNYNFLKLS